MALSITVIGVDAAEPAIEVRLEGKRVRLSRLQAIKFRSALQICLNTIRDIDLARKEDRRREGRLDKQAYQEEREARIAHRRREGATWRQIGMEVGGFSPSWTAHLFRRHERRKRRAAEYQARLEQAKEAEG